MTEYSCNIPDFSKLCRACLNSLDYFKYSFYDNVSPDDYSFCTSIEITKDEKLPKTLCNICYDLLLKLSKFKRTCIQSHKILLAFRPVKEEIVTKINEDELLTTNNRDDGMNDWLFDNETKKNNFTDKIEYDIIVKQEEQIDNNSDFDSTAYADQIQLLHDVKKTNKPKRLKIKTSKRRKKYTCKSCNKEFSNLDQFKIHKSTHQHKIKALKCTPCNKTFVTWSGLRRHHTNWHSMVSLNSVKCHTCGKIATSRETLVAHQKLHGKRRQYICNVCGKSYSTSTILQSHLETHKENRERQYTCEHCGKKFYTKKCLVSHVSRCHTGKKFICQICSYPFTDKYNLAKHLQNHEGKKFFKCKVCDKSFSTRQIFIEHQRIHSGERPYLCNYCSKSFISKKRLSEHQRIHTGEKPHKCSICDHSFTQRGTLTRHMKIHERPPLINKP